MEEQKESKNLENVNSPEVIQKQEDNQTENLEDTTPKKEDKMFKHEIYDRLPFTYQGVDRFVKIMIGVTIAILIFAIATR
jgi:hypothetical protein